MEANKETAKKSVAKTTSKPAVTKKTATSSTGKKTSTKVTDTKVTEVVETKAVATDENKTKKVVAKKENKNVPKLNITLVKSTIGCLKNQKRTIEAMGLRKIRSTVMMPDNACTRGMIYVVKHLVRVEEVK